MRTLDCGGAHLVRLDPGDEVCAALEAFAAEAGIGLARVEGIGAADRAAILYFHVLEKRYEPLELDEDVELVSVSGNICVRDGRPFAHLHAALGRADFSVVAGHLKSARISVTGEFFVTPVAGAVRREPDAASGLALLSF